MSIEDLTPSSVAMRLTYTEPSFAHPPVLSQLSNSSTESRSLGCYVDATLTPPALPSTDGPSPLPSATQLTPRHYPRPCLPLQPSRACTRPMSVPVSLSQGSSYSSPQVTSFVDRLVSQAKSRRAHNASRVLVQLSTQCWQLCRLRSNRAPHDTSSRCLKPVVGETPPCGQALN